MLCWSFYAQVKNFTPANKFIASKIAKVWKVFLKFPAQTSAGWHVAFKSNLSNQDHLAEKFSSTPSFSVCSSLCLSVLYFSFAFFFSLSPFSFSIGDLFFALCFPIFLPLHFYFLARPQYFPLFLLLGHFRLFESDRRPDFDFHIYQFSKILFVISFFLLRTLKHRTYFHVLSYRGRG